MSENGKIILDKSYVHGESSAAIAALRARERVLMPDILFYEMITSEEPSRSRCFAKFPGLNPVPIVTNVGSLLALEQQSHQPCGLPSMRPLQIEYQFNPKLREGDYKLPTRAKEALLAEGTRVKEDVRTLIEMTRCAPQMFPTAFSDDHKSRILAREEIRRELAESSEPIVRFFGILGRPGAKTSQLPAHRLTAEWMHFRWLQVKMLLALHLACTYGRFEMELTPNLLHAVENYAMDAQYLMLAAIEGGLATKDNWMRTTFLRVRPDGILIPESSKQ